MEIVAYGPVKMNGALATDVQVESPCSESVKMISLYGLFVNRIELFGTCEYSASLSWAHIYRILFTTIIKLLSKWWNRLPTPNMLNLNYNSARTKLNTTECKAEIELNVESKHFAFFFIRFVFCKIPSTRVGSCCLLILFPFETMSHYVGRYFIRMTEPEILRS